MDKGIYPNKSWVPHLETQYYILHVLQDGVEQHSYTSIGKEKTLPRPTDAHHVIYLSFRK